MNLENPYAGTDTRRTTCNIGEADLAYVLSLYPEHGARDAILGSLWRMLAESARAAGFHNRLDRQRFAEAFATGRLLLGTGAVADGAPGAAWEPATARHD